MSKLAMEGKIIWSIIVINCMLSYGYLTLEAYSLVLDHDKKSPLEISICNKYWWNCLSTEVKYFH